MKWEANKRQKKDMMLSLTWITNTGHVTAPICQYSVETWNCTGEQELEM